MEYLRVIYVCMYVVKKGISKSEKPLVLTGENFLVIYTKVILTSAREQARPNVNVCQCLHMYPVTRLHLVPHLCRLCWSVYMGVYLLFYACVWTDKRVCVFVSLHFCHFHPLVCHYACSWHDSCCSLGRDAAFNRRPKACATRHSGFGRSP